MLHGLKCYYGNGANAKVVNCEELVGSVEGGTNCCMNITTSGIVVRTCYSGLFQAPGCKTTFGGVETCYCSEDKCN